MSEEQNESSFQFELVSPEKLLASEPATMVIVPGEDGDFGVLPGHTPFLSSLRPGVLEIRPEEGEARKLFVSGGFADVTQTSCTVLAEETIPVDELDKAALEKQVNTLSEDVDLAENDQDRDRVKQDLFVAKAKLSIATGELVI